MSKIMDEHLKSEIYKHVEGQCKDIAMNSRLVEVGGGDVTDFDSKMNEWCEKYHEYFKDKDFADIMLYMVGEMMSAGLEDAKDGRR